MKTLVCLNALIITFLIFVLSCRNKQYYLNYDNLKKVKINMQISEVKEIMGKPDSVCMSNYENKIWLMYNSPSGMSDNFYIYFSSVDSTVVCINDGL